MLRPFKTFSRKVLRRLRPAPPSRYVGLELVGPCNLHCAYCLRAESMLYGKTSFLPREKIRTILGNIQKDWGPYSLALTGGEPTLHPEFGGVVDDIRALGLSYKLVTNGWHFNRVSEHLLRTRDRLITVAFSLDGATRETHDGWRGKGSFDRMMKAVTFAHHHRLPFQFNVVLRRDTRPQMEAITLLGARLGARIVNFGSLLPTSARDLRDLTLTAAEEQDAEREAQELARVFRMPVKVSFVLYRTERGPHCYPLVGRSMNVDHLGRLTLCANLSFFRGSDCSADVIGDASEPTRPSLEKIQELQKSTLKHRDDALGACSARGEQPDAFLASPCLTCLKRFEKVAWDSQAEPA